MKSRQKQNPAIHRKPQTPFFGKQGGSAFFLKNHMSRGARHIQRNGPSLSDLIPDAATLSRLETERLQRIGAPLIQYLNENRATVSIYSLNALIGYVQGQVPQAAVMSQNDVRTIIQTWTSHNNIQLPRISALPVQGENIPPPRPTDFSNSDLAKALRSLTNIPTSIDIRREHGHVNIGMSGATVELFRGPLRVGSTLSWDGTMGLKTNYRGLGFGASLSRDRWELKLSFSADPGCQICFNWEIYSRLANPESEVWPTLREMQMN